MLAFSPPFPMLFFSPSLYIFSLTLRTFPLSCLLARLFLHSLPTLFHSHICIFTSLSLYLLSLSAHFPLSCLLARLFLHSLPTLFHSHICIFTSPSPYIFSHSPHTSPSPVFLPDFSFIVSQPCSTLIFAFSHLPLSISSLSLPARPLPCLLSLYPRISPIFFGYIR